MKTFGRFTPGLFATALVCGAAMFTTLGLTSCKESVDDSAFHISDKKQVMEILEADTTQYSGIIKIFKEVKLGLSENASPLSSVLTSRGNYTLFVPTNEALNTFIHDKLEVSGSMPNCCATSSMRFNFVLCAISISVNMVKELYVICKMFCVRNYAAHLSSTHKFCLVFFQI